MHCASETPIMCVPCCPRVVENDAYLVALASSDAQPCVRGTAFRRRTASPHCADAAPQRSRYACDPVAQYPNPIVRWSLRLKLNVLRQA
jgi:hypothetical protein